ncbi:MAG: bifunctional enoyl-CoA hydratase/phosphate acetyltransferase [Candidatus Cloacimonadota bacterium]|nr:bifunctional enoyl-CoA hydratase/phosphate acetyltransferase [Candidatus Cloacimonadota bacterium]
MIKSFDELMDRVKSLPIKKVAVPGAAAKSVIKAACLAKKNRIADFLLVGNENEIRNLIIEEEKSMLDKFDIIDESDPVESVKAAVRGIHEGRADLLLKGKITTSQLMRGVLDKKNGLKTGSILSDVFIFESPDRLTLMTDGGVVLYPELKEKIALINNSVKVAHHLGNPEPKVALLAAIEVPNPKMPPTMDAPLLAKMNERGQIKGCIVDGPFALDNAISEAAAQIKGVDSPVAGKADILIMPNIEAGNIFGKAMTYYAHFRVAHVIMGAKVPILITSRADDAETKLLSIALGIICA